MIEIQHKTWIDDSVPYLDEDMLNDNQQALEGCVAVFLGIENEMRVNHD